MAPRGAEFCRVNHDCLYPWLLSALVFVCHVLTGGVSFSIGVYYVTFLEVFSASNGATSWIGSLNLGMLCGAGPLASYMIDKVGVRVTVMIGGITSSCGLLIGALAPSLEVLFISIGFIAGIGYGLVFTSGVVVISVSLTKYRTIAMGVSISGIGLGNFAYPFLATYLMSIYGWRGSLMMTAALTLNVCVLGMLMAGKRESTDITENNNATFDKDYLFDEEASMTQKAHEIIPVIKKRLLPEIYTSSASLNIPRRINSNLSNSFSSLRVCRNSFRARNLSSELIHSTLGLSVSRVRIRTTQTSSLISFRKPPTGLSVISSTDHNNLVNNELTNDTAEYKTHNDHLVRTVHSPEQSTLERIRQVDRSTLVHQDGKEHKLFAFTLLNYWLLHINTLLFCLSLTTVLTHIAAFSRHQGIDEWRGNILLSVNGAANVLGRVILGAVTQHPGVNALLLHGSCYLIAGVTVLVMTKWTSLVGFMICSAAFGIFSAAFGPVLSEVTLQVVGLDRFNYGYGFLMISMALGTTLGAPAAGWIYDGTRVYESSFYFGGGCLVLSSALMLPLFIRRRKNKTSDVHTNDQEL